MNYVPTDADLDQCFELGRKTAVAVKESRATGV